MGKSRRSFMKKAAIGSFMYAALPAIVSAEMSPDKKISLSGGTVILFQGDSITDAGRNRDDVNYNSQKALGNGYAMLASASLLEQNASREIRIYNRGISGNKVFQLAERWDKDCIDIKPDILSILIGVNDFWHTLDGKYDGTLEKYRSDYIALLERTKKALPDVSLIVCEPFAVKGVKFVDDRWYPGFYYYQEAAREIAGMFGATFIPFQKIFDSALKIAPGSYWTTDGVHVSLAGAQLMAKAWLDAIK